MTDGAEPAVLFLDADGTLIPFGRRPGQSTSAELTAGREPSDGATPLLSRLDAEDGHRLLALGCHLVWATSWMDEANEEISPRLGVRRRSCCGLVRRRR